MSTESHELNLPRPITGYGRCETCQREMKVQVMWQRYCTGKCAKKAARGRSKARDKARELEKEQEIDLAGIWNPSKETVDGMCAVARVTPSMLQVEFRGSKPEGWEEPKDFEVVEVPDGQRWALIYNPLKGLGMAVVPQVEEPSVLDKLFPTKGGSK